MNYAELEEDILLMARVEEMKSEEEHIWFLDSGCSNHMSGMREWFFYFDNQFSQNVKLGDDRRMMVEEKGSIRLQINGTTQVITSVYFVPGLKNNLLSVGQLQQKRLKIIIDNDVCEIWHKQQRRMIMKSKISRNHMFVILAVIKKQGESEKSCLHVTEEKEDDLWHKRLGHLSHRGIQALGKKKMVTDLLELDRERAEIVCEVCMKGKQNKENIPKKSMWRASRGLELVHSDICGPITPTSTSKKRYIINFIDDFSRKCWSFFISEKSEALQTFKEFKAAVERELGQPLICLRTDRGGEYNSTEFQNYCKKNRIKRQLTVAYTPQQNGILQSGKTEPFST